jgi:hypothetical protein
MGSPFQKFLEVYFRFLDYESLYFLTSGETLGRVLFSLSWMLVSLWKLFLMGEMGDA